MASCPCSARVSPCKLRRLRAVLHVLPASLRYAPYVVFLLHTHRQFWHVCDISLLAAPCAAPAPFCCACKRTARSPGCARTDELRKPSVPSVRPSVDDNTEHIFTVCDVEEKNSGRSGPLAPLSILFTKIEFMPRPESARRLCTKLVVRRETREFHAHARGCIHVPGAVPKPYTFK